MTMTRPDRSSSRHDRFSLKTILFLLACGLFFAAEDQFSYHGTLPGLLFPVALFGTLGGVIYILAGMIGDCYILRRPRHASSMALALLVFLPALGIGEVAMDRIRYHWAKHAILAEARDVEKRGEPARGLKRRLYDDGPHYNELVYDPTDKEAQFPTDMSKADKDTRGCRVAATPVAPHLYSEWDNCDP